MWTSGGTLEEDQVKSIRNVVASAYAGLDRNSITITDMTSHLTFGGSVGRGGIAEGENIYASYKLQYERDWQRKIGDTATFARREDERVSSTSLVLGMRTWF